MSESDYCLWCNFVLNAIAGHNPDAYFREHRESIVRAARCIREKLGVSHTGPVFRGLLVPPELALPPHLAPMPHITYLSFSIDEAVAQIFADPAHPIGAPMMAMPHRKNYVGILCREMILEEEVLFDFSWYEHTALVAMAPEWAGVVKEQREIILENRNRPLDIVTKVAPNSSRSIWSNYPFTLAHGMECVDLLGKIKSSI